MPSEVVCNEVYPPEEDTYLLLRVALAEARSEDAAIEIGCGSGLISRELAGRVRRLLATDINPAAIRAIRSIGAAGTAEIDVVRADLFRGLRGRFDLVIFNPPYLPTAEEERTPGWMNYALDGGRSGRETINRFLEDLPDHLAPGGRALLLISSLTGQREVQAKAAAVGLGTRVMATERCFFEQLYVLRLSSRA
jgi:release factor glutamine methyltransferase